MAFTTRHETAPARQMACRVWGVDNLSPGNVSTKLDQAQFGLRAGSVRDPKIGPTFAPKLERIRAGLLLIPGQDIAVGFAGFLVQTLCVLRKNPSIC